MPHFWGSTSMPAALSLTTKMKVPVYYQPFNLLSCRSLWKCTAVLWEDQTKRIWQKYIFHENILYCSLGVLGNLNRLASATASGTWTIKLCIDLLIKNFEIKNESFKTKTNIFHLFNSNFVTLSSYPNTVVPPNELFCIQDWFILFCFVFIYRVD